MRKVLTVWACSLCVCVPLQYVILTVLHPLLVSVLDFEAVRDTLYPPVSHVLVELFVQVVFWIAVMQVMFKVQAEYLADEPWIARLEDHRILPDADPLSKALMLS